MSTLSMARSRSAVPAVLASVLVGAVPLISACGAGQNAPTRLEYSVADGVQAHAGNVVMRNLQLVADVGDGNAGATVLDLQGVVANNTGATDTLDSVTATTSTAALPFAPSASAAAATGSTGIAPALPSSAVPTSIPASVVPGIPLLLGSNGLGLQVSKLPSAVLPGSLVSLTFAFDQSGSVTVDVPVYSLASRLPASTPATRLTFPQPNVNDSFNQPEFDNESAAPSA